MIKLKRSEEIKTYDQVIEAMDKFTLHNERWQVWELTGSFGHIVLDDENLSDGNILFCLHQSRINEWFDQNATDRIGRSHLDWDTMTKVERFDYENLMDLRDDIIMFLRWLLEIPEEIREDDSR